MWKDAKANAAKAPVEDASSITELHEKKEEDEEEVARINFLITMSKVSIHEVNAPLNPFTSFRRARNERLFEEFSLRQQILETVGGLLTMDHVHIWPYKTIGKVKCLVASKLAVGTRAIDCL